MNIKELIVQERNKLNNTITMLTEVSGLIPESLQDKIDFIISGRIYFQNMDTLKEVLEHLHGLDYKVSNYFMCHGRLSVTYVIENKATFGFFIKGYENALKQLGNGKCHVEEENTSSLKVVCNLGE